MGTNETMDGRGKTGLLEFRASNTGHAHNNYVDLLCWRHDMLVNIQS